MVKNHHPRRGSLQFWPRKRSKHSLVRVRSWATQNSAKPLGFVGYKAGMAHVQVIDNAPKSMTKGEAIVLPTTLIDCPPMGVLGVSFYKKSPSGLKKMTSILAEKLPKEISRSMSLPKKTVKKFEEVKDYEDLRLIVFSNPRLTPNGTKKPKIIEIQLGGKTEEKVAYAKEILGKEIKISDVFESGSYIDVHGVTKGKGYQGTVKRYGVAIKQHKGEKTKRGIGNLGAWTPKRVQFQVPQPGKMGFHLRTDYNKQIIKVGSDTKEVTPKSGILRYGIIKNEYALLKGSVMGAKKKAIVLTQATRPDPKASKEAPELKQVIL